jgi:hypothetical protein
MLIESAEIALRQVTEGENEKNIFPPLDTTLAPYVLANHCNAAKISNIMTTLPMLSSMSIQASTMSMGENDENAVIMSAHADLSALLLSWNGDTQIQTMTNLHEMQQTSPSSLPKISAKNAAIASSGEAGGPSESQAAGATAVDAGPSEEEQQTHDTDNVDVQLTQLSLAGISSLIDLVKKKSSESSTMSSDVLSRATSFVATTPSVSPRNSASPGKISDKKKKGKKEKEKPVASSSKKDKVGGEGKKEKQSSESSKPAKKKPKANKPSSKVATHGSIKVEMMPHLPVDRVEGASEEDRVIQEAMMLCHGSGFGFMNITGLEVESMSQMENMEAEYVKYCDQISEAKRQLLAVEESVSSSAGSGESSSSGVDGNSLSSLNGTKLSLYSVLTNVCTLLNHRKEAGVFMQKFCDVANTTGLVEYQAMGCRMQLDYEEWMSAPNLSQMVAAQKLTRLQGILQTAKKYFFYAEQAAVKNPELYYDAWKRLVNTYTEIGAIPDTPGAPKPPDAATLEENLALLSSAEIDSSENNDINWMKMHSRIRAKAASSKLSISLQESVESSTKRLINLGG